MGALQMVIAACLGSNTTRRFPPEIACNATTIPPVLEVELSKIVALAFQNSKPIRIPLLPTVIATEMFN